MSEISTGARRELVKAIGGRYCAASPDDKGRILDEFVALTGYHRKHAIRVLNGVSETPTWTKRGRLRLYDEAVRETLIVFPLHRDHRIRGIVIGAKRRGDVSVIGSSLLE